MDEQSKGIISRRAFLRGIGSAFVGAGTMALLPRVDGGYLMPVALAQELGGSVGDAAYTFHVVKPDEVGIHVVDVDNQTSSGTYAPVKNVTVTITSLYNQVQVSGVTDSEGKVFLSLKGLSVPDPDDPTRLLDDVYQCNARIDIDTSRSRTPMRSYSIELEVLVGQNGYVIGAHGLSTEDTTYLKTLSFDRWDILSNERTWYRSTANKLTHVFKAAIEGVTSSVSVTFRVYERDEKGNQGKRLVEREATSTYDEKDKVQTAVFEGQFLQKGHSECLNSNTLFISISYKYNDLTHETLVPMDVEDAPISSATLSAPFAPILKGAGDIFSFTADWNWPCFNGFSLSIWNPAFPLQVYPSWNLVLIGIGVDFRLKDDKGFDPGGYWQEDHKDNALKRGKDKWDDLKSDYDDAKNRGQQPFKGKNGAYTNHTALGFLNVSVIAHVIAGLQYAGLKGSTTITKKFEGDAYVIGGVDVAGGITFKFMIGSVPMFVSITGGLQALVGYGLSISKELLLEAENLDASDTDVVYDMNSSVSINLKPSVNVTVGAGFKGWASIGLSGTVAFPIYIGWGEYRPSSSASKTHVNVDLTFRAEIAFQFLLIKGSIVIWSTKIEQWYDNWKGKTSQEGGLLGEAAFDDLEARFLLTHPGEETRRHTLVLGNDGTLLQGDPSDPFADFVVMGDSDLDQTKEALARGAAVSEPLYDAAMVTIRRGTAPRVTVSDDGTVSVELVPSTAMNTFVFGEVEPEQAEEDEAEAAAPADEATDVTDEAPEGEDAGEAPQDETTDEAPEIEATEGEDVGEEVPTDDEGVLAEAAAMALGVMALADENREGEEVADVDAPTDDEETSEDDAADDVTPTEEDAESEDAPEDGDVEAQPAPEENDLLGDAFLGFAQPVGADFDYDYDTYNKTTGAACDLGGVKGIAAHNGITPTVDVVVYQGVFSDPRQKIVEIGGTLYLFRIMTVVYPTSTGGTIYRSRVVASTFDIDDSGSGRWSQPRVIEYSSGRSDLARIDMFDYDFDIVTRSSTSTWVQGSEACLVVTGGLRPVDATVYDVFANPTVSVVLLNDSLRVVQRTVNQATSLYGKSGYHAVLTPRIVDGFAAGGASGALGIVFLHRSSTDKRGLLALSSGSTTTTFALGYCFVRDSYLAFSLHSEDDTQVAFDVQDVKLSAADGVMRIVFTKETGYEAWSATIPSGGTFDDVVVRRNVASDEVLPEIQPWPGHGTFLFAKNREDGAPETNDYHLYEGTYAVDATQDALTQTQVDSAGIKSGNFCVSPSGHFLLYYETFEGNPGDDIDPDTGERTASYDKIHRIMASKYQDGAFSEEFPFCELADPIDHFQALSFGSDASSFMATQITDLDSSASDLRYIAVPHTIAAEAEGFGMLDDFAFPGQPCVFQLDVRNHGNMIIDGFDVELLDADRGGMLVQKVSVRPIDPSKILLNASNRSWSEGLNQSSALPSSSNEDGGQEAMLRLTEAEEQGLFVPGKLLSYPVTFDIPEDWVGDKNVTVRVLDATTPGIDDLGMRIVNATSEDHEGYGLTVARHCYSTLTIDTSAEAYAKLTNPLERVTKDEPESPSPRKDDVLPQTGDAAGALAPLGLALGGLTAALGAYARRRADVEREEGEP